MAIAHITVGDVDSISKINQAIDKANLVDDKLTNNSASERILGRSTSGTGAVELLTASGGLEIASGTVRIEDGGVGAAKLASKVATNAKLADMATKTYKGRTSSGTGAPEDLTVAQMKSDLGITAAEQAINAEESARETADQGLQSQINTKAETTALTAAVHSLQSQIDDRATTLALSAEAEARQDADAGLQEKIDAESEEREAEDGKRPLYGQVSPPFRPGEATRYFTSAEDGDPITLQPMSDSVASASPFGKVAALNGAGTIAPISAWRIEPGHVYRVRFVVQRSVDTDDPSNDAVRLGVRWLKADKTGVSTTELANLLDLTVSDGRVEYIFTLATTGASDIDAVSPAGAVYFRPLVRTFGGGVTHVEVIQVVDATDALVWSPNVEMLQRQIASLAAQIQTLSDRVQTLES